MRLFTGSPSEINFDQVNPKRGRYDICLTRNRDVAAHYATERSGEGVVYEVEFDGYAEELADIADVIEDLTDIELDGPFAYLALDDVEIQEALVEDGYDVIEYHDEDWNNDDHDCIRVLAPGRITVINQERV